MKKDFGVVYVATGEFFAQEAIESARQIKNLNREVKIALFTDKRYGSDYIDHEIVIEEPLHSVKDKMLCLPKSPFYYNLFADSDTYFVEDPSNLQNIFDYCDFACTHAPQRINYDVENMPDWFPEVNGGLLLYSLSQETMQFFVKWREYYEADEELFKNEKGDSNKWPHGLHEQPTLRKALFESGLRLYILPPEYNFRTIFPNFAGGKISMLHGRMKQWGKFVEEINRSHYPRIVCPNERYNSYYVFNKNSSVHKFISILKKWF